MITKFTFHEIRTNPISTPSVFEIHFCFFCFNRVEAANRGDGSKPKRGTNSISTGTKIVPVRKNNIIFVKNDELPTPTYSETRIVDIPRYKYQYKSQQKKPQSFN